MIKAIVRCYDPNCSGVAEVDIEVHDDQLTFARPQGWLIDDLKHDPPVFDHTHLTWLHNYRRVVCDRHTRGALVTRLCDSCTWRALLREDPCVVDAGLSLQDLAEGKREEQHGNRKCAECSWCPPWEDLDQAVSHCAHYEKFVKDFAKAED